MSELAFAKYRTLVEKPSFLRYFHEATPIDQISLLNIGSRPARRKTSAAIADLRAIPWVFAWTQSRVNLPSWYGVGTALEQWVQGTDGVAPEDASRTADERLARLHVMYRKLAFLSHAGRIMCRWG